SVTGLSLGIELSPFRCGLGAVSLFFLYLWREYRNRSYLVASVAWMLCAVSGPSLSASAFNVFHCHFAPFFFLGSAFLVFAAVGGGLACLTFAGLCLSVALLSPIPVSSQYKFVIFAQVGALWIGFVHWLYFRLSRQWVYSLAGIFVCAVSGVMCLMVERPAW